MQHRVSLQEISSLLGSIKIARIGNDVRVPVSYSGFHTEILIRMQLLPYLMPLKSERTLAFEVAERPELQRVVGLDVGAVPSRATLWHFRKKHIEAFRALMIRSLALISMEADAAGIRLPFVNSHLDTESPDPTDAEHEFFDPRTGRIVITVGTPTGRQETRGQKRLDFPEVRRLSSDHHPKRVFLHEELGFPIRVRWNRGEKLVTRILTQPRWLDSPYEPQELGLGRAGKAPYTACNLIVLKHEEGYEHVLLSRRLRGSGSGSYALPGGKRDSQESVRRCVARELQEEVGIGFRAGRPVSRRVTHEEGYPLVISIGVLVTKWVGAPRRREHLAHSNWDWYKMSDLPSPLFFPTKLALDDYAANEFPDLSWDDVEDDTTLPLWR